MDWIGNDEIRTIEEVLYSSRYYSIFDVGEQGGREVMREGRNEIERVR